VDEGKAKSLADHAQSEPARTSAMFRQAMEGAAAHRGRRRVYEWQGAKAPSQPHTSPEADREFALRRLWRAVEARTIMTNQSTHFFLTIITDIAK